MRLHRSGPPSVSRYEALCRALPGMTRLSPGPIGYDDAAHARLCTAPEPEEVGVTEARTAHTGFRLGDEGDAVLDIRSRLAMLDLVALDGPQPRAFDADLDRAVRAFQQGRG